MTTEFDKQRDHQDHIENIDKGDLPLLILPNMLQEHELRYELMAAILEELNPDIDEKLTVIDMASARGLGTEILREKLPAAKVTGLEIGWQYLKKAQEKRRKKSIEINYVQADILRSPLPANSADGIAMFEILEHIPQKNQLELLTEAFRIVKDKGLVAVSIPFPYSFNQAGQRIGASSNPFHQHEPTKEELIEMVQATGFEIVGRYGQSFAANKGIDVAQKLEKALKKIHIPAWTVFAMNLNFMRDPKPVKMDENQALDDKTPLTQIFILKKPIQKTINQ